MTERELIVTKELFAYHRNLIAVQEYMEKCNASITQKFSETGIRGSAIPNPTQRLGIMAAELPYRIQLLMQWIEAIEDALDELMKDDDAKGLEKGRSYLMVTYFCMNGEKRDRADNAKAKEEIAKQCGISTRTLYAWMSDIYQCVIYHAAKRELL